MRLVRNIRVSDAAGGNQLAPVADNHLVSRTGKYAIFMAAVVAAIGVTPGAAVAHGAGQIPDAAYYRAEITGISPAVTGQSRADPYGEVPVDHVTHGS